MIAQALFTPAQQKLLGLLFVRVNEGFHLNEIMRLTGLGSASAQLPSPRQLPVHSC